MALYETNTLATPTYRIEMDLVSNSGRGQYWSGCGLPGQQFLLLLQENRGVVDEGAQSLRQARGEGRGHQGRVAARGHKG